MCEKDSQGFRSVLPSGDDIADGSEEKQTETVRNQKGQQSGEPEFDGELNGEEEAEPPNPGKGNGVPPEEDVQKMKSGGWRRWACHVILH